MMKRKTCPEPSRRIIFILIALVALLVALPANDVPIAAQSGGGYELTWSTVDGGGATFSTGGTYSLGGTIGQFNAGTQSGGTYTLVGGFWSGSVMDALKLYLPMILKNP